MFFAFGLVLFILACACLETVPFPDLGFGAFRLLEGALLKFN